MGDRAERWSRLEPMLDAWIDAADEGSESLALANTTDVFDTVAEIAGVTVDAEHSVSLVPYLRDPTLATRALRPYVYAERFEPNGSGPYTDEQRAIRDDRYDFDAAAHLDVVRFDTLLIREEA